MAEDAGGPLWLVDAHVHIQPDFDTGAMLDAAADQMTRAARGQARALGAGVLALTENAGVDAFSSLAGAAGRWRIAPGPEPVTLTAQRPETPPLFLVSGRQIVTEEGLEIHALGTRAAIADGHPAAYTIAAILAARATAVVPWGVGKWSGARGQAVGRLIAEAPPGVLFADSGVRTGLIARPALLDAAAAAGRGVIAGTDPLPLGGEETKPGRFGIVAPALDPEAPWGSLSDWLFAQKGAVATFGRLESPWRFLYQQIAMQVRKRLRR